MKKFILLKSLLLTAILLVGSGSVTAQIAAWNFRGIDNSAAGATTHAATTFDANLISTGGASNITRGPGVAWSTGANSFRTTGFQNHAISTASERYFQITLTAAPGHKVSLSTIDAQFMGTQTFVGAGGVTNQFAYSLDGTNFTLIGSPQVLTGEVSVTNPLVLNQIDLTGIAALQNVESTTITIRYYASGQTTTGGWGFFSLVDVNGLAIGGTVTSTGGQQTVATPTVQVTGEEKATDIFWNNADVTLSTATADATIHFTTDGSAPTTASAVYSAPFNITANTTIRAIAVRTGFENSAVAERTITIAPPAVATLPYNENFVGNLGEFYAYSVTGDQIWRAVTATGTHTTVASMNGFASGANHENEDWLISPAVPYAINLPLIVSFANRFNFNGDALKLKYSWNYSGHGDPTTATWIDITDQAVWSAGSNAWAESGNIIIIRDDVLTVEKTIRFAFVYTSTTESGAQWQIANFSIEEAPTTPTIVVTETSIPEMSARVGRPATQTITVSGMNLTGNIAITVSGANASLFSVNPSSVAQSATATAVTITYAPTAENGPHTATLRLNSAGAQEVTFELNGVVRPHTPVPDVIIVEVYGGGGNSGAPLRFDFVTLFNTTNENINIGGWSLQYLGATTIGTATVANTFVFPENTIIAANDYFLIQFASQNEEVGAPLPVTPNLIGTINLAGAQGKIILYRTSERQPFTADITSITGNPHFQDYVPYGVTAVPVWGSILGNLSNTTSAQRKMEFGEYVHTQNVGADFEVGTPNPRAGVSTGVETPQKNAFNVFARDGQIMFNTSAGKVVEVYNVLGQMITSQITIEGLNTISVNVRGIAIVRVGNQTAKVKL